MECAGFTLGYIAELANGRLKGDPEITVTKPSPITSAQEGDITFYLNPKYKKYLETTKASCVVVPVGTIIQNPNISTIEVEEPYLAMIKILSLWEIKPSFMGISEHAFVSEDARIDKSVTIYPFAFIGKRVKIGSGTVIHPFCFIGDDCVIGQNVLIYPNVTIYSNCEVGDGSILHSGVVIGADGFGFTVYWGEIYKIPQVGSVKIGRNVEIGANSCVDRATMGDTIVNDNTKIDNQCQIAHNVIVGKNVRSAGQSGIAGSSEIGDWCVFGGQVGVVDHLKLGVGVIAGARAAVMKNAESGQVLLGTPAVERKKFLRTHTILNNLPDYIRKIQELEKRISELERKEKR